MKKNLFIAAFLIGALSSILVFIPPREAVAQSQGVSVRAFNGLGTNLWAVTNFRFSAHSTLTTNFSMVGFGDGALIGAAGVAVATIGASGINVASNLSWINFASGNGLGITNVHEKNVPVTTNTWGNAVVNFSLGTYVLTNFAGDLTLTGISGFTTSNLNWQTVDILPAGATRTVTIPSEWVASGAFTNDTVGAITNGTGAFLHISAIIGRRTNANLEVFW